MKPIRTRGRSIFTRGVPGSAGVPPARVYHPRAGGMPALPGTRSRGTGAIAGLTVRMPGIRLIVIATALAVSVLLPGCGKMADPPRSPTPPVDIGGSAQFDDVSYIAIERVGLDRLPRTRLEEAGEARIESLARRVTAYRLKDSPKAALRYTADGARGWLTWQPLAVLYARRDLARSENIAVAAIQTLDVTHETWADDCLGAARPGQSCTAASIPGFRVMLRLGGRTFEYHTDQGDRAVNATV